ncbi:hypothetical protein GCM10022290_28330 [Sagittula marina]
MRINTILGAACACAMALPLSAGAEVVRAVSEMRASHAVSAHWGSSVPAQGAASLTYDRDTGTIIELVMTIDGTSTDDLAPAGPGGMLGSIHIHNYPQGGPNFFIQQLPGEFEETDSGFVFRVSNWKVEDPIVGPEGGADFVLSEVERGNAYFGLHTNHALCPGNTKDGVAGTCAAPGTALSGHITVLPAPHPDVVAMFSQ